MLQLVWLMPLLPLCGFIILSLLGQRLPRALATLVGAGSVGLSALIALGIGYEFLTSPPAGHAYRFVGWTWMSVGDFSPAMGFYLDPLAVVMCFVVAGVGFLIHVFSSEFMESDPSYPRFFAYMNLFVSSMLVLVLADNLVLLYLGWEGVGLCSYLLIGFWYEDPANGKAARKAFIVTRVGDTAMAVGLFLLFINFGTLTIQDLMGRVADEWTLGAPMATLTAVLLLGGAVGKSAQLPLQTWLPDAMAGPTPVSALIHAATMVTAGVYLIARTHVLFALSPTAMLLVGIVGAATLLIAGFSALMQSDIKRVLAYSTISQIGYMFLALGVGAWSAAIFHLMTHAFFKALLFLGAGVIIHCLHHEHNLFRMGGLRKQLPLTFWMFLIAGGALAGFPFITAGFYSKDLILYSAWSHGAAGKALWAAGYLGAFMTAIYTFRLIFLAFFGEAHHHVDKQPGLRMTLPLLVLTVLSVIGGFVNLPGFFGHFTPFSDFLEPALPGPAEHHESIGAELFLLALAILAVLLGIFIAYRLVMGRPHKQVEAQAVPGIPAPVEGFWRRGWDFDALYDAVFVRPFVRSAEIDKNDFVDWIYTAIAATARGSSYMLNWSQTGRVRWYAAGIILGAALLLSVVVF